MLVKVAGGVLPLTIMLNGTSVGKSTAGASGWSIRPGRALRG